MQTFLPIASSDFNKTAKVLDNLRLNKQSLEAWQIMMTNLSIDPNGNYRKPKGWANHPAVIMWKGYEVTLYFYIKAMTDEWISRGYKTTILDKTQKTLEFAQLNGLIYNSDEPYWMKDKKLFHELASSHRIALLNKNYDWYSKYNWIEDYGYPPKEYNYIWYK